MKSHRRVAIAVITGCCALAWGVRVVSSQGKASPGTVQVHLVITDQGVKDDNETPVLRVEDLQVKQGKNPLRVDQLIPARDDNAALQLFVLIDDTCDASIGNNLNDLRDFINTQPPSTMVGVAYMSNATVQIAQNLTADHAAAAKAVRLPRGNLSAMDSPYLSLISLVKSWPQQKVRRQVLMVSDGIDRLRGESTSASTLAAPGRPGRALTSAPRTMPTISSDADTASNASQRYGVIVHSIYSPGVGRLGRNAWEAQLGQSGVAKIADETGGEYFALGTQSPVSFKPYLDRLQRIFNNQYFLVFQALPRKKEGLQRVNISTQVANADIASANNVWVPAGA
jgi:hypothetical protein